MKMLHNTAAHASASRGGVALTRPWPQLCTVQRSCQIFGPHPSEVLLRTLRRAREICDAAPDKGHVSKLFLRFFCLPVTDARQVHGTHRLQSKGSSGVALMCRAYNRMLCQSHCRSKLPQGMMSSYLSCVHAFSFLAGKPWH